MSGNCKPNSSLPADPEPRQVSPAPSRGAGPYAAWQNADYRRYACSWFALTFGKQIETVAVGIHLYERTRDPMALGWLGLVQALPVLLLAIPGGQIADRFDRRRVMILMLALGMFVSLGLAVLARLDAPIHWFYLLLAFGATTQALGSPSRSALLPEIVSPSIFSNAVTWNSSVFQVASMTGPAVGGLIVAAQTNASAAFATVAVCRLLSLVAIVVLRHRSPVRVGESISLESLMAGIRFVWNTRLILATITLDLFAVLLGGATYLLPIYAKDILHVDAAGLGFLRSAEAIGAVSMAMLLAHLPPMRHAGRTMLWAVAGFGVATIVFGLSQWFWLSMAMMFLIGAMDNISVVVRHTLVQMLTPDHMRGRVSAINSIFIVASNDLGGLESGFTARLLGPVVSVVAGGLGAIVVVLGTSRIWPQILSIGSLQDIRPAKPIEIPEKMDEELATHRG
ncbi:MAG: MFS transporter [Thermoguttaceae bacterium]